MEYAKNNEWFYFRPEKCLQLQKVEEQYWYLCTPYIIYLYKSVKHRVMCTENDMVL